MTVTLTEISVLEGEIQSVKAIIEFYKNKLEKLESELAILKMSTETDHKVVNKFL